MTTTKSARKTVEDFLKKHGFDLDNYAAGAVSSALLDDMRRSLAEAGHDERDGSEPMIPTWISPSETMAREKSVIVIDAGGTNFRSCLVRFGRDGTPAVSDVKKSSMPGVDCACAKDEFFDALASRLSYLRGAADSIGFCFSYKIEMLPDGDAKIMALSKEMQAVGILGSNAGESLSDALERAGWARPQKVSVINDSTAALFAGVACVPAGRSFGSYAGLILGTGINTAYVEAQKIGKLAQTAHPVPDRQIVVCESGSFGKLPRCDFDIDLDDVSNSKGFFLLEKMCGGAYLPSVAFFAIRRACADGIFSERFASEFKKIRAIGLRDTDDFLRSPFDKNTKLGGLIETDGDRERLFVILDTLMERAARVAASTAIAAIIKTGAGQSPAKPVRLLCNGTTFYKTYKLKERFTRTLDEILAKKNGIHYELASVENDIIIGTAAVALRR